MVMVMVMVMMVCKPGDACANHPQRSHHALSAIDGQWMDGLIEVR